MKSRLVIVVALVLISCTYDKETIYKMAHLNHNKGNYEIAINQVDYLITRYPEYAEAYCLKGATLQMMGAEINEFVPYYDSAIKFKSNFAEPYVLRGLSKEGADGLIDVEMAVKLKPDFAEAYNARGLIRSVLSDDFGAIADYSKAIDLKVSNISKVYSRRGYIKLRTLDYRGAFEDLNKAINIDSLDALSYYSRCQYYRAVQKPDSARKDYKIAVQLGLDTMEYGYNRVK